MDPRAMVATGFYDVLSQFVGTLSESYPGRFNKDDLWPKERKVEMFNLFVKDYKHLFAMAKVHDVRIFEDDKLKAYKDLVDDASLQIFWQYADLVRFGNICELYDTIPGNVMSLIGSSISSIKGQLDAGTLDPKYMNPMLIGQELMSKINPDDLATMMNHLTNNQDQMLEMMQSAMALMEK
jgi:hypothetical protein